MQILSLNFLIYTVGGIWRPVEWSSNGAKLLYSIFTFIIVSSEYFLMITQFMDIVLGVDNIDDFATNTLLFLTFVNVCCKATFVLMRRNTIINLMRILMKTPCKPRDEDESAIQTKFDRFIRSYSIKYALMATSSVTGTTIGSVLNVMQGRTPYRIWLPWNYNIPLVFWTISIHQIVSSFFATMISIGTDTLIFGLLLQTCAQLEIFESRLHKLIINKTVRCLEHALSSSNKDKTEIAECIRQHLNIYKYAKTVNGIFNQVLFVQFFGSILILCTSVYYMSIHIIELSKSVTILMYTVGMFVQIYVYCWSGNEVILKSTSVGDAIYCMDWPLLSAEEKRELLIIMIRSTIPIKFTSSFLITLSLQSYSNILRTSYSAFNILQNCEKGDPNMQILSFNFLMYTLGGIWRPVEWSSNSAKLLYSIFTYVIMSFEYILLLTQFMDIIFVVNNINDFATSSVIFLTVVAVCCKATVVVARRNAIISLVQLLLEAPCKPRDENEVAIQTKFDKLIRSWSIKYSLLCMISLTGVSIGSVLNIIQGQLPCRIWLPWDYNVPLIFWIICIQQLMSHIFGTIIGLGTDTLIFGLFIQTCAQIEIFESRLHKLIINNTVRYLGHALSPLNEDKTNISEIIRHHLSIYKYAKTVNVTFNQILFIQFFVSILVICTSVYYLSMHITELFEIGLFVAYTICMCVQIYIYCWSGNEVMLKSMGIGDAVYHMDWPLLSVNEKKELLMIIMRSSIPIKFTSSFLITLSLQSYSNVILVVENIDDFTANTLLFLSFVNVCCKATFVVIRRNAIINVVGSLLKAPHKPRNEDEVAIQTKFDKFIRSWSIKYSLLCIIGLAGVSVGSVLTIMQDRLPCRIWLPWDYNVPLVFWIICIQQFMCPIFTTIIGLGTDTLIFGLFIQTCAQIEIFESRLHNKLIINNTVRYLGHALSPLNEDETNISEIIRHHLSIYKYAKTVNDIFREVFFIQFLVSTCVICISVYYLSTHIMELSEIGEFLGYVIGMCVQIYIYCWSGNEIMFKSMSIGDAVYHMDWPLLSAKEKKELLMIMMRSSIPIKFTSSFLITLSLQSFKN
ncbi:uncharacterized protein LOC112456788, partial [Temnothorax curvispinosus]|uniref:Uncharacterized protein LOC112456788 n=1 Tax=Temnothorax curvispinosus TaxID=300111 RepID=A0A6J1PZM0_9HYME